MSNIIKSDVAIITALHDTEYEALLNLPGKWEIRDYSNDNTMYHYGEIGKHKVILATDDQMGMSGSATLSMKVMHKFKPKYIIMAGIAAGVKDRNRNFGDIMICRSTWNYDSGKYQFKQNVRKTIFEPYPEQIEIDDNLKTRINNFKRNISIIKSIKDNYPIKNSIPAWNLQVHFGPIASGSAVVSSDEKVDTIKGTNRKLLGLDMETYGVFYAARMIPVQPKPKALSIKSISDFADRRKNDKYRAYAAYTSVQFVYFLIREALFD